MALFYHNDVDGIVSAALTMLLHGQPTFGKLIPVSSDDRRNFRKIVKKNTVEGERFAVVDYMQHDETTFWCDHHAGFSEIRIDSPYVLYDHTAKSAASLLIDKCVINGEFYGTTIMKNVLALRDMVDMIDSADFPSAEYYFTSKDSHMILLREIESYKRRDRSKFNKIVTDLLKYDFDIDMVVKDFDSDRGINRQLNKVKAFEHLIEKHGETSVIVDDRGDSCNFPRYAEHYLDVDCKYALRIHRISLTEFRVRLSVNPWFEGDSIPNMADILGFYSNKSGGHHRIAGGFIREKDIEKIKKSIIHDLYDLG